MSSRGPLMSCLLLGSADFVFLSSFQLDYLLLFTNGEFSLWIYYGMF